MALGGKGGGGGVSSGGGGGGGRFGGGYLTKTIWINYGILEDFEGPKSFWTFL